MGNDLIANLSDSEIIKERPKKIVNINSVINEQLKCPFCKKLFSSITTIQEFNIHIKHCGLTSTQISKAVELFPPSQDYVLNNKIFENSKKYVPILNSKKI